LPPPACPPLPAGDLAAACRRLRAGLGRHDPAVETIRRAAALDPPLPADDAELWLAAAGPLIAMRNPSGLDPELEAAVMALELADWVGAVVGLVRRPGRARLRGRASPPGRRSARSTATAG
jgi:hypothetical protein